MAAVSTWWNWKWPVSTVIGIVEFHLSYHFTELFTNKDRRWWSDFSSWGAGCLLAINLVTKRQTLNKWWPPRVAFGSIVIVFKSFFRVLQIEWIQLEFDYAENLRWIDSLEPARFGLFITVHFQSYRFISQRQSSLLNLSTSPFPNFSPHFFIIRCFWIFLFF